MVVLFVLGVVIIIGTSFALWQIVLYQTGQNVITTSCLKLNFNEKTDAIVLDNGYPMSDSDGKKLVPYTFDIENVCDATTSYVVNLEILGGSEKILSDKYVKVDLSKSNSVVFNNLLTTDLINEENVIEDAIVAYKLYQGKLNNKDKVSFDLRLWMDEDTPVMDEVMNADWYGKITVTANYVPSVLEKNVMIPMELFIDENKRFHNVTYTRNNQYNVSVVSFESSINPYSDAVLIVDFSEAQDESVLGYYVKNGEEDTYTLHIQSDGKIRANKKSHYYGMNVLVEGLENLDTSGVIAMAYMFYNCKNSVLDLSGFDTSNVENMSGMFYGFSGTTINLSNFDTSKVTNMSGMFYYADNLQNVDLSSFDTSSVVDMYGMFCQCTSLTVLDLSNFNTSNVENMGWMFAWNFALTEVKLGNFNTSKVTAMDCMFLDTWVMESVDLSTFDTSNVDDYEGMFNRSGLREIVYSDKFVYKNGANVLQMYESNSANKPTHESWSGII